MRASDHDEGTAGRHEGTLGGVPEVTGRHFLTGAEKEFGLFYMKAGVKFAF